MKKVVWSVCAVVAVLVVASAALAAPKKSGGSALVKRGEYLVTIGGCNDCHTPWKMGAKGPEQDMSRMLSGHPEDLAMPDPPELSPPWGVTVAATFTAWSGPWGVSFTSNLTPDPETGLGKWTEGDFIETMRTGRHDGRGRPILPPMPWFNYAKMSDEDLRATFAYLRSIPPIKNRVPDPIIAEEPGARPPTAGGAPQKGGGEGGMGSGGSSQPSGSSSPTGNSPPQPGR